MTDWASIAGQLIENGAPILGSVLGGPAGTIAGNILGPIIGQALGVPGTPQDVSNAITQNPAACQPKLQEIERVHGAGMTLLEAEIKDRQAARDQTIELAKSGSSIAWGAPVVSVVGMGGFVVMSAVAVTHGIPPGELSTMIVSTFRDIAIYVVSYWLGSSYGSHAKDLSLSSTVQTLQRHAEALLSLKK